MSVGQKDRNRVEVTVTGDGCGSGSDYRRENGSGSANKNGIEWAGVAVNEEDSGSNRRIDCGKENESNYRNGGGLGIASKG